MILNIPLPPLPSTSLPSHKPKSLPACNSTSLSRPSSVHPQSPSPHLLLPPSHPPPSFLVRFKNYSNRDPGGMEGRLSHYTSVFKDHHQTLHIKKKKEKKRKIHILSCIYKNKVFLFHYFPFWAGSPIIPAFLKTTIKHYTSKKKKKRKEKYTFCPAFTKTKSFFSIIFHSGQALPLYQRF